MESVLGFTLAEVILIGVLSLAICILATALAMESAALFIPAFLIVFPAAIPTFPMVSANEAVGLTLVIMLFGQTSTITGYWFRNQIRLRLGGTIVLMTIPAAIFGRLVAYWLPELWLLIAFSAILFGLASVLYRAQATGNRRTSRKNRVGQITTDKRLVSFGISDRVAFTVGGLVAGVVGFAIGEVSNVRLHVNKRLPIKIATGTSTLMLYVTLLSVNAVNLLVLSTSLVNGRGPVTVPWSVAAIVAPIVVVGGQIGAFLNSKLPEEVIIRLLMGIYVAVDLLTVSRIIF